MASSPNILGHCIYEGIWVGEGSSIPNTRGIRNDVVAALKRLKVPVDEYHWKEGRSVATRTFVAMSAAVAPREMGGVHQFGRRFADGKSSPQDERDKPWKL